MSELSLSLDECLVWAMVNVPFHKQSRYLTDIYRKNKVVNNASNLIQSLDPKNFMFIDKDIYYKHIDMIKEIASIKNSTWEDKVEHSQWIEKEEFTIHEWLKYYINPNILTKENISTMPINICVILLGQIKKWYETDPEVHACCLIAYLDQIHYLLMRSGSPEYIEIFNNLANAYEGTNVEDCVRCEVKGRKNKRVNKFGR